MFGLLPPASLLRLSAAPAGGGGRGRWGGGPGGVPDRGEGSGNRLGMGGRAGGPGSGISSRRLLLRSFSLLAGELFLLMAAAAAALELSWMIWKFFLNVLSPGALIKNKVNFRTKECYINIEYLERK